MVSGTSSEAMSGVRDLVGIGSCFFSVLKPVFGGVQPLRHSAARPRSYVLRLIPNATLLGKVVRRGCGGAGGRLGGGGLGVLSNTLWFGDNFIPWSNVYAPDHSRLS